MSRDARGFTYRSVWVPGVGCRKAYLGRGAAADLAEALARARREAARRARAELRAARSSADQLAELLGPLEALADLLDVSAMLAAGFHLYKRQWRRRRGGRHVRSDDQTPATLPAAPDGGVGELRALCLRTQRGDEEVLPLLREALARVGDLALLERACDSPATWAQRLTCEAIAGGDNRGGALQIRRHAELLQARIEGDACTPLERIIVRRVVMAWLVSAAADASLAQHLRGDNLVLKDFASRHAARCERRLTQAALALARLRRLALPRLRLPSA